MFLKVYFEENIISGLLLKEIKEKKTPKNSFKKQHYLLTTVFIQYSNFDIFFCLI